MLLFLKTIVLAMFLENVALAAAVAASARSVEPCLTQQGVGATRGPSDPTDDQDRSASGLVGGTGMPPTNLELYLADLQQRALAYRFLQASEELLFAAKSAKLSEQARTQLLRMADFLRTNPDTMARIASNMEDLGGVVVNLQLAEERAARVREYLIAQGIEADRLLIASGLRPSLVDESAALAGPDALPGPPSKFKVQISLQKRASAPCPPGS